MASDKIHMPAGFGGLMRFEEEYEILDVTQALQEIAQASSRLNFKKECSMGAINNCLGRWFELVFFKEIMQALDDYNKGVEDKFEICKLPSASKEKKFINLFIEEQRSQLKTLNPSTSNPDFILLNGLTQDIYPPDLTIIEKYQYNDYYGTLNMSNLFSVISIKTSARPDRRYQQVYEANLIKALFKRFDFKTRFFVITLYENEANNSVYASASIESILLKSPKPYPSIDKAFVLKTNLDIRNLFNTLVKWEDDNGNPA